jgi:hypothetical protein
MLLLVLEKCCGSIVSTVPSLYPSLAHLAALWLRLDRCSRGYLGQFIPDRLKKTFNVLMVVSTDVGSDEDREGCTLRSSSELIDFLQRRAFQASFQRAEIRTAAHCRKILLREVFTGSNLLSAWPKAMLSSIFRSHKRNDEALSSPIGLQSIVFILGGAMFTTYPRAEIAFDLPDEPASQPGKGCGASLSRN